jgi:hypothetical protein
MPLFTSLLLFFVALAMLPLALHNGNTRKRFGQRAGNIERMSIGAQICEAAMRDIWGANLDRSVGSIVLLNALISENWVDRDMVGTNRSSLMGYDAIFVLGSYLGNIFIHPEHAEWRSENGETFIYFRNLKRHVSPFRLIERKLQEPNRVVLQEETAHWLNQAAPQDDYAPIAP